MGGFLQVDDDVLRGMALALKQVDKEAKKEWSAAMRTTGTRLWRSAVSKRASRSRQWQRMYARPAVRWSQGGKGAAVITIRPLSGGLDAWPALEFGSNRYPQLPARNDSGHVAFYAVTRLGPYMGSMAVRTVADVIRDTVGGD